MNPGQFANVKYRKWADLKREAAQIEERQPIDQSPPTDAAGDWGSLRLGLNRSDSLEHKIHPDKCCFIKNKT